MQPDDTDQVARRRVFYIPGYDPIHPRRYRELYRAQGAGQAAISGYELTLAPGRGRDGYGWHVELSADGRRTEADIEVLAWSDIVRTSMSHGIVATYLQLVRTAWIYVGSGAIFRLARLRKGPTIAALFPIVVLLLQLAVAIMAGWVAGLVAIRAGLPSVAGWVAGLVVVWGALWQFRQADNRVFAYYLMHDYAFASGEGGANPPALEARMRRFGDRIAAALAEDWDEVLVVGHSSGAQLAVSILADLIRAGRVSRDGPALGLLTLGQVIPMVAFLPRAQRLRTDLAFLSEREELAWIDVTAPGDGCAFALCDPVSVSGVAQDGKRWPLVISAAFTQTLSAERWRALRWRFFRLHFQYLCAFDRPGDYDYFLITAGPKTLAARYRDRTPSASRVETPLNRYRDVA